MGVKFVTKNVLWSVRISTTDALARCLQSGLTIGYIKRETQGNGTPQERPNETFLTFYESQKQLFAYDKNSTNHIVLHPVAPHRGLPGVLAAGGETVQGLSQRRE